MTRRFAPNPDLSVGADHKQRWNSPMHRRHGFHNAHQLFRRAMLFRSRHVRQLTSNENEVLASLPEVSSLIAMDEFSALACLHLDQIVLARQAADFSIHQPHSIQSITKMHIHLIVGSLKRQGLLDLTKTVDYYLPDIGSGYRDARVQNLLNMTHANDFSEDYDDPLADCYREEIALGWRLPAEGEEEPGLRDFVNSITGSDTRGIPRFADYKSSNTDVLTLICAKVSPRPLSILIEEITDRAGYEGAFTISASKDGYPAFSGGGCLSAIDLARFGLLFTDGEEGDTEFLQSTLHQVAPSLSPPKDWLRYSNHVMTDGRFVCHAGYGGQFLMVDRKTGLSCAFLSVLVNEAGYDDVYMDRVIQIIKAVCQSFEG